MTDYQGGSGNGSAWYCNDFDAPILRSSVYDDFNIKPISSIVKDEVKSAIAAAVPNAEAAPTLNYLMWLLRLVEAIE